MQSKECDKPRITGRLRATLGLLALMIPALVCAGEPRPTVRLWPTAVVVHDPREVLGLVG